MFWNVRAMPSRVICTACVPSMRAPSKSISPSVGVVDTGQQVEDRGLAGAVGTDESVQGAASTCR